MEETKNTSATAASATHDRVNYWERKLLDLTKSNALIHIRYGSTCIALNNQASEEFYTELAGGTKFPLSADTEKSKCVLQTSLDAEALDKNAKEILRAARSNLEEVGNSQLFVAIGMLKYWTNPNPLYPSEPIEQHCAPALLIPVMITRQRITGVYYIASTGEEPMVNVTLIELLKQQHERDLSALIPEADSAPNYQKVMETFEQVAARKKDWEFTPDTCLGIFSFAKFVMWDDIHTNSEQMRQSSLVESLVQKRKDKSMTPLQCDARTLDTTMKPTELALPLDTDSSQIEAVVDATSGKSFLLYGPPGTGKSQTITNIIANAIYHKQQVLFVAQKRAALEVVQERLRQIGIAPFCFELHSNKATKSYLINQLEQVLESDGEENRTMEFQVTAEQLFQRRTQLLRYIEAVYKPHTIQGEVYSLADCIEQYSAIDETKCSIPLESQQLRHTTDAELNAITELLREMSTIRPTFASVERHPLRHLLLRDGRAVSTESVWAKLQEMRQTLIDIANNQNGLRKWFCLPKLRKLYSQLEMELHDMATTNLSTIVSYPEKQEQISQWLAHRHEMSEWCHYSVRWNKVAYFGYSQLADAMDSASNTELSSFVRRAVYRQRATDIIESDETLAMFNGQVFEDTIADYRRLSNEFQELTKQILHWQLQQNVQAVLQSPSVTTQASLTAIRRWLRQHGRGMSIRHLFNEHGEVLRKLCPCMLMSPISVAQYLPIKSTMFNIVLFDEASQIPTSEAVGAIARGKAVVVVGDPKQMPPTTFFQTQLSAEEDIANGDMESILDDCITLGMPEHYLNYHYRSRHESLIAFSNHYFYDDKLVTFPSADNRTTHLHYRFVDGVYDYSATRTNKTEAEALVQEVIQRLEDPELCRQSMGIIAFSKVQQDLIEDMLQERLAHRRDLEKRAFAETKEPLFVKNLENVQGDERDVILLSVGYGRDKNGKISMNFGPLNNGGGERRLNVAVTRARQEMLVFTGMHAEDIDLNRSQALGVKRLKGFLYYAERHELPAEAAAKIPTYPLHPMAYRLAAFLKTKGYQVDLAVGQSDFRIDIAVQNSAQVDTYRLGILIDNRRYHRTPTMRDREIVQPKVLCGLGWNIVRIWQEDYLRYPQTVEKRLLALLEQTK